MAAVGERLKVGTKEIEVIGVGPTYPGYLKKFSGWAALSRFMQDVEMVGFLYKVQALPYSYAPTTSVFRYRGRLIRFGEYSHKVFAIHEVDPGEEGWEIHTGSERF